MSQKDFLICLLNLQMDSKNVLEWTIIKQNTKEVGGDPSSVFGPNYELGG